MLRKIVAFFIILLSVISINFLTQKVYAADTVDSVISGADDFLEKGDSSIGGINQSELHETSNFIYNLLLAIALILAVIVGIIIGIQFMTASVEEKAKIKESLVPYVVGCVVVFGAFGIWKLAVTIMSQV